MKKRVLSFVLVILALSINLTFAQQITDINNHWGKEYISNLIDKGVIGGYPDNTFKPNNNITIAEFTKIITVAIGEDIKTNSDNPWYLPYVDSAKEKEIIIDGEFTDYNRQITRGEMARMIVRAIGKEQLQGNTEFKDNAQIPSTLKGYIKTAASLEIIGGYPDGTFKFDGKATRAEASKMIAGMFNNLSQEDSKEGKKSVESFLNNKEELFESNIEYAEIVTGDKYTFETYENDGQKFIISDAVTYAMVIIKDDTIIEQIFPMPSLDKVYYPIDTELKEIDYIGIYRFREDSMELVENPFKEV